MVFLLFHFFPPSCDSRSSIADSALLLFPSNVCAGIGGNEENSLGYSTLDKLIIESKTRIFRGHQRVKSSSFHSYFRGEQKRKKKDIKRNANPLNSIVLHYY